MQKGQQARLSDFYDFLVGWKVFAPVYYINFNLCQKFNMVAVPSATWF